MDDEGVEPDMRLNVDVVQPSAAAPLSKSRTVSTSSARGLCCR